MQWFWSKVSQKSERKGDRYTIRLLIQFLRGLDHSAHRLKSSDLYSGEYFHNNSNIMFMPSSVRKLRTAILLLVAGLGACKKSSGPPAPLVVTVSTLAGNLTAGDVNGNGTAAQFSEPYGVAYKQGNIYVADYHNFLLRQITLAGTVTSVKNNMGTPVIFPGPSGVALDVQGNIYVSEFANHKIDELNAAGVQSVFAGNAVPGYNDGPGSTAQFNQPYGIACDANGHIYVADTHNNRIRAITSSGMVSTLAGNGTPGWVDGNGTAAEFDKPEGIACDAEGNILVTEIGNNLIRKVTPAGIVSTVAGSGVGGYVDGPGKSAQFNSPEGIALDPQGNMYVADYDNALIRKVTPAGVVSTLAGNGTAGYVDGDGKVAEFFRPFGMALDGQGNIYVGDLGNNMIRKITVK
jgi:sugar lactone lactonase YvrE